MWEALRCERGLMQNWWLSTMSAKTEYCAIQWPFTIYETKLSGFGENERPSKKIKNPKDGWQTEDGEAGEKRSTHLCTTSTLSSLKHLNPFLAFQAYLSADITLSNKNHRNPVVTPVSSSIQVNTARFIQNRQDYTSEWLLHRFVPQLILLLQMQQILPRVDHRSHHAIQYHIDCLSNTILQSNFIQKQRRVIQVYTISLNVLFNCCIDRMFDHKPVTLLMDI